MPRNQEVERVFPSESVAGGAGCKFIELQGETKKHFPPVTPFKRLFWSHMINLENYQPKYSPGQLLPIWFCLNIILWLKYLPKSFSLLHCCINVAPPSLCLLAEQAGNWPLLSRNWYLQPQQIHFVPFTKCSVVSSQPAPTSDVPVAGDNPTSPAACPGPAWPAQRDRTDPWLSPPTPPPPKIKDFGNA